MSLHVCVHVLLCVQGRCCVSTAGLWGLPCVCRCAVCARAERGFVLRVCVSVSVCALCARESCIYFYPALEGGPGLVGSSVISLNPF